MSSDIPMCMGLYDFDHIAKFAKMRWVDGVDTVSLIAAAHSQTEREEIMLVSLLDIEEGCVRDLHLSCPYADACEITDCRSRLKRKIRRCLECS